MSFLVVGFLVNALSNDGQEARPVDTRNVDVQALVRKLEDKEPAKRREAADALGKLGARAKTAIPALMAALKDEFVSSNAALALRGIGAPAVPALVKGLKNANPMVRARSALGLAKMDGAAKSAVPALKKALKDHDARVRLRVAYALWNADPKQPDEDAVMELTAAVRDLYSMEVTDFQDECRYEDVLLPVLMEFLKHRLNTPERK
jgi:HEAT repeat protein